MIGQRTVESKQTRPLHSRGFTLVELLVVIIIIGILVTIGITSTNKIRSSAREAQVRTGLGDIQRALEAFGVDHNALYPYRVDFWNLQQDALAGTNPDYISQFLGRAPMGLFGGALPSTAVSYEGGNPTSPAPQTMAQPEWGESNYDRVFNRFSDPLFVLKYLKEYPTNPFMKRGMGAVAFSVEISNPDQPIPYVRTTPGDFVYTQDLRYDSQNNALLDPPGVILDGSTYVAYEASQLRIGYYRIELVDHYRLWAYGAIPEYQGNYPVYDNSIYGPPAQRAKVKDQDGDGVADEWEKGILAYISNTTRSSREVDPATGLPPAY